MKIGAIVPAYNAGKRLVSVIDDIKKYLGQRIIVVDDGSIDNTVTVANEKDVIVLSHSQNKGKGEALKTGFRKALSLNWSAVITIDADGQHNPYFIQKFLIALEQKKFDIIIGSRMKDLSTMPFHRTFSNITTSKLISWRIGQKIIDSQSGYRLIKTEVLKNITLTTSHYDTETELLLRGGFIGYRIGFIDIDTIYHNEPSSIRLFLDTGRFIKLFWSSFFWK